MESDEERQIEAIAADWNVDPNLVYEAQGVLESVEDNDGTTIAFLVRFNEDADPELLDQLGVSPGELYREVSLSAFDEPDYEEEYERSGRPMPARGVGAAFAGTGFAGAAFAVDDSALNESTINGAEDGISSIDEPLPDISGQLEDEDWNQPGEDEDWNNPDEGQDYTKTALNRTDSPPRGQAFLTDDKGNYLTDQSGDRLTVDQPQPSRTSSIYASAVYGSAAFGSSSYGSSSREQELDKLTFRVAELEDALAFYRVTRPPRSHNHPPELVEPEPISLGELQSIEEAVNDIKAETQSSQPDAAALEKQASTLRKVAASIMLWIGRKLDKVVDSAIQRGASTVGLATLVAGPEKVYANLIAVADAISTFVHHMLA